MDSEFHYFVTGIVAHAAGFSRDEAGIIAYASQFVDDNDMEIEVKDKSGEREPYRSVITQTMDITKPRMERLEVYPAFHFIPGTFEAESAYRSDGKMHLLNTTPDSPLARMQLKEALNLPKDDPTRLYRIGIACHAYADTFAHQNYAGISDTFNGQLMDLKPNIGHADAEHHPDWPGHRWQDDRLVHCDIDNNMRFISAAGRMYDMMVESTGRSRKDWDSLSAELSRAFGPTSSSPANRGKNRRLEQYHKLADWLDATDADGEFDDDRWLSEAIDQEVRGLKDPGPWYLGSLHLFPDRFWWRTDRVPEETNWYLFQQAAKDHLDLMLPYLMERTKMMGITLVAEQY